MAGINEDVSASIAFFHERDVAPHRSSVHFEVPVTSLIETLSVKSRHLVLEADHVHAPHLFGRNIELDDGARTALHDVPVHLRPPTVYPSILASYISAPA